jgi:geranylgeranyl reductase family protein
VRAFDVDVAIAGAGPAGTAAAFVLARAGRSVLLVDSRPFPRDKVCGDLIGSEAVATLAELGLDGAVLAGALPLSGAVLHGPRGTRTGADATREGARSARGAARVLPRRVFDARLLERAREAGAALARGRVSGLLREPSGRVRGLQTSVGDISARVTIGADGWGSAVARALGVQAPPAGYAAVTVRAYATGARGLDRRMHFFINRRGDGYAWVFPLGDGAANVGLGFITGEPDDADLKGAFARFTGTASPARALLAEAELGAPAAWPIPLGWRGLPAASPGVLLGGDAAGLASPLSGSGIHTALASGSGAARFALRALGGDDGAWRAYEAWLRRRFAPRLRFERVAHTMAGTPERVEPWLALVNAVPGAGALLSRGLLALG